MLCRAFWRNWSNGCHLTKDSFVVVYLWSILMFCLPLSQSEWSFCPLSYWIFLTVPLPPASFILSLQKHVFYSFFSLHIMFLLLVLKKKNIRPYIKLSWRHGIYFSIRGIHFSRHVSLALLWIVSQHLHQCTGQPYWLVILCVLLYSAVAQSRIQMLHLLFIFGANQDFSCTTSSYLAWW